MVYKYKFYDEERSETADPRNNARMKVYSCSGANADPGAFRTRRDYAPAVTLRVPRTTIIVNDPWACDYYHRIKPVCDYLKP